MQLNPYQSLLWYLLLRLSGTLFIILGLKRGRHVAQRTFVIRIVHAVGFEGGLLLICLPLYMLWYGVSLTKAFTMEATLLLFFLIYTFVFTLIFDNIFTLPDHNKTVLTSL